MCIEPKTLLAMLGHVIQCDFTNALVPNTMNTCIPISILLGSVMVAIDLRGSTNTTWAKFWACP